VPPSQVHMIQSRSFKLFYPVKYSILQNVLNEMCRNFAVYIIYTLRISKLLPKIYFFIMFTMAPSLIETN
jgi:hypothetical protein